MRLGAGLSKGAVLAASLAGAVGLGGGVALGRTSYPPVEVLFKGGETTLGQPIVYPAGTPVVTAAIVTMVPGQETGWHEHDAPLLAWMLDGELTVDYGPDGSRVYRKGDAFLEAFRSRHNGRNSGGETARLLAVFIGAEGVANTVMDPE